MSGFYVGPEAGRPDRAPVSASAYYDKKYANLKAKGYVKSAAGDWYRPADLKGEAPVDDRGQLSLGGVIAPKPAAPVAPVQAAVQPGAVVLGNQDQPGPADEDNPAAAVNAQPATPAGADSMFSLGAPPAYEIALPNVDAMAPTRATTTAAPEPAPSKQNAGLLAALVSLGAFLL